MLIYITQSCSNLSCILVSQRLNLLIMRRNVNYGQHIPVSAAANMKQVQHISLVDCIR